MISGLTLRTGYFDDKAAFLGLASLLEDTFGIDITHVDQLGGPDPTSMPFAYFDEAGRCVANFTAFCLPLIVDGRSVRAAGYQSGAVRPEFRGQGLYRDLMRRAFGWSGEQGFERGLLLTDKPSLYQPFGFRSVAQHCFRGRVQSEPSGTFRVLSIDRAEDVALIQASLAERLPVSEHFAVAGHAIEFLLNACFDPAIRLGHMVNADAVIAWRDDGEIPALLDVVGRDMPSVSQIADALGISEGMLDVCFPIDRLPWQAEPQTYEGACVLMARGDWPALFDGRLFMLSPMAEF